MVSIGSDVGAVEARRPTEADAALLELAAGGDVESFDALVRPRLDRLYRIAVAILRSEADARDAVQDGTIHAWRALPRLRERDRFDAWLTQIVVNDCRSLARNRVRRQVREIPLDELRDAGSGSVLGPGVPVRDIAEAEAVERAFDRLDPTARALLVLHYVDERPLKEIGPLVGAPVGTVKWRLWRARRVLERALEGQRR